MIDEKGFRAGVAIIIMNDRQEVLWAKRIGQEAWQFPQGGMHEGETSRECMYRELKEEVGLDPEDVEVIKTTPGWLRYLLPEHLLRHHSKPLCIGQKQKWFLLKLVGDESHIRFDQTGSPEFDGYAWVKYWHPLKEVIDFKRNVYRKALRIFSKAALPDR